MFRFDGTPSKAAPARERVTVRHATATDEPELARLAALDSARPITGAALVAESDARIIAALPLGSGRPIADPFEPSAELVALLELRAAQLRGGRSSLRLRDRVRDLVRVPLATKAG
jgi:hypothetical protein